MSLLEKIAGKVSDFGAMDRVYLTFFRKCPPENIKKWNVRCDQIRNEKPGKDNYVVGQPPTLKYFPGLIPRQGRVFPYSIPSSSEILDPEKLAELLERIGRAVGEDILENSKEREFNLIGVSLPTVVIPWTIREYKLKPNKITLIVPGNDIVRGMETSVASREKFFDLAAECNSVEGARKRAREALGHFEPGESCKYIDPDTKISVYIGARDLMVPVERARALVEDFRNTGLNVGVEEFNKRGHVFTIGCYAAGSNGKA